MRYTCPVFDHAWRKLKSSWPQWKLLPDENRNWKIIEKHENEKLDSRRCYPDNELLRGWIIEERKRKKKTTFKLTSLPTNLHNHDCVSTLAPAMLARQSGVWKSCIISYGLLWFRLQPLSNQPRCASSFHLALVVFRMKKHGFAGLGNNRMSTTWEVRGREMALT